ncbi:MAG: tyrosine-type recombinase/integrase, partial [Proteobacteria bacterium]|nr:tyrosine-type recombinase/integrase [Pseudomonadota bacterium]
GMLPGDGRLTVRRLAGQWLESIKHSVRPSTYRRYEGILRVNVISGIGKMRLTQLQPAHLENLYAQRLDEGMSPQTVDHVHRVIHAMLEKATRWGIVPRNVASLASPPKVPHREMVVLSVEECQTLLSAAGGTRLEVLWWIAIGTGLRAGEILALRWRDLDFDRARLHVRHTLQRYGRNYSLAEPKTARSRRIIALTTTLSAKLTQHRARQNEERLVAGPMWTSDLFDEKLANSIYKNNTDSNNLGFLKTLAEESKISTLGFYDTHVLSKKLNWSTKLLGLSFLFFLAKGLLWLALLSVVILRNLS